ncbi:DUF6923 family protein [Ilumatobacter sp.]|uniref:DUF6923 family protein n=1 Tax=Ilumatobacter sp. TaxID=1967498 RepID=UPI003AF9823D
MITSMLAVGALLGAGVSHSAQAHDGPGDHPPDVAGPIFADGGVMAGSTNGISFAPDGTLWIANVLGATITQIDPDSGEILSRLTAADGVLFPDDVVVGDDYTIYWTDIGLGTVFKKPFGQPAYPLVFPIPGGLNSANPLTLNDDGSRLWAAGCYGGPPANNSFVELDPDLDGDFMGAGIINVLRDGIEGCASNGMSWNDGYLYAPQPFTNEILRLDPEQGADQVPVPVTTGWPTPIGTAFDSNGDLYSLAQGVGEVVKVDIDNPDTENNRTVIAEIPIGWADNIAISADDRIFISSASDATIVEVLPGGKLRTVVPGLFQLPLGVAAIGNTLYTSAFSGLVSFDRRSHELKDHFRAAFGVSAYPSTTSIVAWRKNLVLMSALTGQIMLWNPKTNEPVAEGLLFPPTDAQPFRGDLVVTQGNGEIVRLSEDLVPIDVVANVPGATGLARKGGNVYVADHDDGTVLQIIKRGEVLDPPVVVVDGLAGPEGIDIKGNQMYVVEGGTQTLTRVNLRNGKRKTIATDLGLQDPTPLSAFGWFNDVNVVGNDIYVNADRANVIYEFPRKQHRHW